MARERLTGAALLAAAFCAVLALPPAPWATGASVGGRTGPDGTVVDCDLPHSLHMRNKGGMGRGGPGTGSGLCVFTSVEHAAKWQGVRELWGFQEWMTHRPGGGWPEKLDQMIREFCASKGVAVPAYIQIKRTDQAALRAALASGRMVSHTYLLSPTKRYRGAWIEHMVNSVAGSRASWAVLDNNHPGAEAYEWCSPAEWLHAHTGGGRRAGWAVVLVAPPPPPPPIN